MQNNLRDKAKAGVVWDLLGSLLRQIITLGVSIVLARILGPKEFGIIGMSMVFVSISQVFVDVGFTSGLIQQKETNDVTLSSVFFTNFALSILISALILVLAPTIANFYNEPRVGNILVYLSIIPPIAAIGKVQSAILIKRLDFKSLTIRDFVATIVGGALGVLAAFSNYGVYSLVIQQIAMATTATIMLWSSTNWRPKFVFSWHELKKLFKFSSYIFIDALMRQIFLKIDTLFVGKVFSATTLGFYSRAESLMAQIQTYTTRSLGKVTFPLLSDLQNDDVAFKETYFKSFNIITGVIVLLIAPIYFLSDFIIIFLFGEKWFPSIEIFQILLISILFGPQGALMGNAILAKGLSSLKFKIGIFQRIFKLTPIALGFFYGITVFTWGMVIASILVLMTFFIVFQIKFKISFTEQFVKIITPNIVFIILIVFSLFFNGLINPWLLTFLFFILQFGFLILIKHESFIFIEGVFKKLILKIKSS